jgi:hypothetical protein
VIMNPAIRKPTMKKSAIKTLAMKKPVIMKPAMISVIKKLNKIKNNNLNRIIIKTSELRMKYNKNHKKKKKIREGSHFA